MLFRAREYDYTTKYPKTVLILFEALILVRRTLQKGPETKTERVGGFGLLIFIPGGGGLEYLVFGSPKSPYIVVVLL